MQGVLLEAISGREVVRIGNHLMLDDDGDGPVFGVSDEGSWHATPALWRHHDRGSEGSERLVRCQQIGYRLKRRRGHITVEGALVRSHVRRVSRVVVYAGAAHDGWIGDEERRHLRRREVWLLQVSEDVVERDRHERRQVDEALHQFGRRFTDRAEGCATRAVSDEDHTVVAVIDEAAQYLHRVVAIVVEGQRRRGDTSVAKAAGFCGCCR